jgi:hypothetical protein
MAEQDILLGGNEVETVVQANRRCGTIGIDPEDLVCNEESIETVGDRVRADSRDHQPDCVDRFASGQGNPPKGTCADHRDEQPDNV